MALEIEIKEAIEKNLPSQVGSVLQERLKSADRIEKENASLRDTVDKRAREITDLSAEVKRLNSMLDKHFDLDIRLADITDRERNFDLATEKMRSEFLSRQVEFMEKTMDRMLGNRIVRENIQKTIVLGGGARTEYSNGGQIVVPNASFDKQVTDSRTVEES